MWKGWAFAGVELWHVPAMVTFECFLAPRVLVYCGCRCNAMTRSTALCFPLCILRYFA